MKTTFPSLQSAFIFRISLMSLLLALSACNPGNTPLPGGQGGAAATPVNLQMGWTHEYSSAGIYAAEENGRFAEQGLEVTLLEGGFNEAGYIDPITQVLEGKSDFGIADGMSLILARAEGKPVVAIASILQQSPFAIISLAESNLSRPQDLVGKTVSVADGGSRALFQTLLIAQAIDPASVNAVARTSFGIDILTNHEVDALGGWIINEGVQLREAGYQPNFILPSDYGVNVYQTVIFSTETTLAEKPETVEKFLRALLQGWDDVLADPAKAVDLTLKYNSSLTYEGQLNRLQASLPLIKPAGSSIGVMTAEVWSDTQDILVTQGILKDAIDLNAMYTTVYLDRIYGK